MVHPYRPLHAADEDTQPPESDPEGRILAGLLIVLGLARVVPALVTGEAFGTEATIASLMLAAGISMLVPLRRWLRRITFRAG